jgi:hypothetical protein
MRSPEFREVPSAFSLLGCRCGRAGPGRGYSRGGNSARAPVAGVATAGYNVER